MQFFCNDIQGKPGLTFFGASQVAYNNEFIMIVQEMADGWQRLLNTNIILYCSFFIERYIKIYPE